MSDESYSSPINWFFGTLAFAVTMAVMLNPLRRIWELASLANRAGGHLAFLSASQMEQLQLPQSVSIFVYLAMFGNYVAWTWYGIAVANPLVFIQNGIGVGLTIYYLTKWIQLAGASGSGSGGVSPSGLSSPVGSSRSSSLVNIYPSTWAAKSRLILAMSVIVSVFSIVGLFARAGTVPTGWMGTIAVVCSVLLFGSPLSALKLVITQQHTGSIDLTMAILLAIMGGSWVCYGLLIGDPNLVIPNAIGVILSVIQLSLFFIFPRKRKEEPLFL